MFPVSSLLHRLINHSRKTWNKISWLAWRIKKNSLLHLYLPILMFIISRVTHMGQQTGPPLVQIRACCLFFLLIWPWALGINSIKIWIKINYFYFNHELENVCKMTAILLRLQCVCWHIEAKSKWPPFCRKHFQTHFRQWKHLYFELDLTEICSKWPI